MGKYDDIANQTANETDKDLKEDIEQMLSVNGELLEKMFPSLNDRKLVQDLISVVQKSTNRNETVTAYKVFAASVTKEGLKAFKEGFAIAKKLVI